MLSNRRQSLRSKLLNTTAAALLAFPAAIASGGAFAQDQDQDDTLDEEIDTVIVTGSRIRRAGFDTVQPAIVIDSEFIDERGFTNLAQALNEIPAFGVPGATNTGGQSTTNLGANFVNAFGLGSQRTLTLINGRRAVGQNTPTPGGAASGLQVDLNIIPTALIDRVETVFVGGAPIYGSDAVAATVNVILKDDFEGLSLDAQFGIAQRGDAENFRVRGLWGGNFADGRGNATVSAEFVTVKALDGIDRQRALDGFGFCSNPANTGPADGIPDNLFCKDSIGVWAVPNAGLPTLEPGLATSTANSVEGAPINNSFVDENGIALVFNQIGELIPITESGLGTPRQLFFSQGSTCGIPHDLVTCLPETNSLISPLDRWIITGNARYQISDRTEIFIETLAARSEAVDTNNQPPWSIAVFGPGMQGQLKLNLNENPFIRAEVRDELQSQLGALGLSQATALNTNLRDQLLSGYNPDGSPVDATETGLPDGMGGVLTELDPTDDVVVADFVAAKEQFLFMNRSNIDIVEGRSNRRLQNVLRFVTGFEGDFDALGGVWNWDAAYTFGVSDGLTVQNDPVGARFNMAIDAVRDPNTGDIICRVNLPGADNTLPQDSSQADPITPSDINNCVPIDVFGFEKISQEAKDFINSQNFISNEIRQQVIEANVAGDLFEIPAGPLGFAAGVTHRREKGRFDNDSANLLGIDPLGESVNVVGAFNTYEIYAETVVPIVSGGDGLPIRLPFIESLDVEGAIRFVDNTLSGNDITWSAGGRMRTKLPFIGDALTLRGNFTRSIRSPSIAELFLPVSQTQTFANDPCDPRNILAGNSPANRLANCTAEFNRINPQGITLNSFQSIIVNASQQATTGGNPNLLNETANSWTVGGILEPDFIPGLSLAIDWTQIQLTNAIVQLSATAILEACFDSPSFPNPACNQFSRNADFQIVNPQLGFVNASEIFFSGLVANLSYNTELADLPIPGLRELPGALRITSNFFHTHNRTTQVGAGAPADLAGLAGNEKFRFQVNVRYSVNRFSLLYNLRHTGGGRFSNTATSEFRDINRFPSVRYHSISMTYRLSDSIQLRAVINNMFDKIDGPRLSASIGGNSNRFNDVVGRRFVFALSVNY